MCANKRTLKGGCRCCCRLPEKFSHKYRICMQSTLCPNIYIAIRRCQATAATWAVGGGGGFCAGAKFYARMRAAAATPTSRATHSTAHIAQIDIRWGRGTRRHAAECPVRGVWSVGSKTPGLGRTVDEILFVQNRHHRITVYALIQKASERKAKRLCL